MLIGLTGTAGTGKTTAARYLRNHHGFKGFAFADALKTGIESMFDVSIETLEMMHSKDDIIPGLGTSLRKLYQTLGTDWGRNMINTDIWVNLLHKQIERYPGSKIVITDVRFENEAQYIRDQGGGIIHLLSNRATPTRKHSSEHGVAAPDNEFCASASNGIAGMCAELNHIIELITHGPLHNPTPTPICSAHPHANDKRGSSHCAADSARKPARTDSPACKKCLEPAQTQEASA